MPRRSVLFSPRDLGDMNRARVLRALVDHGPLARAELARLTGVTRTTIGSIVQGLVDDDLLVEQEAAPAGVVGKPARPLWFAVGAGAAVALELRADGVRGAVVDARGHIEHDRFEPVRDPASAAEVVAVAARLARRLASKRAVIGAGVAVPGTVEVTTGRVHASTQVPGAVGTALVEAIAQATGLVAFVENDSRAHALAEQWFGLGRRLPTFASVQTGGGLNVALVLDGLVHRGPQGAGEIGHHTVELSGAECVCGLRGCWETICTVDWLRREAARLRLARPSTMTCERLSALADDSAEAAALLSRYAENLAVGIGNLCMIFGARSFILHGDPVGGGDAFRRRVEAAASRRTFSDVEVTLTQLGDDAALLGAVALVLSEALHLSN